MVVKNNDNHHNPLMTNQTEPHRTTRATCCPAPALARPLYRGPTHLPRCPLAVSLARWWCVWCM